MITLPRATRFEDTQQQFICLSFNTLINSEAVKKAYEDALANIERRVSSCSTPNSLANFRIFIAKNILNKHLEEGALPDSIYHQFQSQFPSFNISEQELKLEVLNTFIEWITEKFLSQSETQSLLKARSVKVYVNELQDILALSIPKHFKNTLEQSPKNSLSYAVIAKNALQNWELKKQLIKLRSTEQLEACQIITESAKTLFEVCQFFDEKTRDVSLPAKLEIPDHLKDEVNTFALSLFKERNLYGTITEETIKATFLTAMNNLNTSNRRKIIRLPTKKIDLNQVTPQKYMTYNERLICSIIRKFNNQQMTRNEAEIFVLREKNSLGKDEAAIAEYQREIDILERKKALVQQEVTQKRKELLKELEDLLGKSFQT